MRTMVLDVSLPRFAVTRLLDQVWRGAYFAATSPLRQLDLPEPVIPAQDWVRIRNELCGICGSDLHQIFIDAGLDVAPVALREQVQEQAARIQALEAENATMQQVLEDLSVRLASLEAAQTAGEAGP